MMDRKNHAVSLTEWHHLGARLPARTLFGEDELSPCEVLARHREEDSELQREDLLAIEILMQAVVVAHAVVQKERRGPGLPGIMTAGEKGGMLVGIAHVDTQCGVPAVCH